MERVGHQVKAELAAARARVEEPDVLDEAIDRILASANTRVETGMLPKPLRPCPPREFGQR